MTIHGNLRGRIYLPPKGQDEGEKSSKNWSDFLFFSSSGYSW